MGQEPGLGGRSEVCSAYRYEAYLPSIHLLSDRGPSEITTYIEFVLELVCLMSQLFLFTRVLLFVHVVVVLEVGL